MKTPKVSIIIPCYNVPEAYIRRALESVRSQTFRDFEIIVVDDGSREPYSAALEQACRELPAAGLIRIPDSGVSTARNTGIRAAKGDYVAFLDADDVLAEDFLERALFAAEETGVDFVIGGLEETDEVTVPYLPPRAGRPQIEQYNGDNLHQMIGRFLIGLRSQLTFPGGYIGRGPVSRLIRREIAQKTLFDSTLTIGEDLIWNLQLLKACQSACIVRESWYSYWQNPQSAVHRYQPAFIDEYRKLIEKLGTLINTKEDGMYASYADQIYEGLRLFWFRTLSAEKRENRKNYQKVIHGVYTESPWTEIGTKRYFRQVGTTKKITALLYRLRLFYAAMAWKERLKPSDVVSGKKETP